MVPQAPSQIGTSYPLVTLCLSIFSDRRDLQRSMLTRKSRAFRPGTVANHEAHVRLFAAFAIHIQVRDFPAPVTSLLLFAEFLLRTYRAPKSVVNALSSLKTFHLLHGLPAEAFQDYQLALFKRALLLTVRQVPQGAPPLPFQLLERLCAVASEQGTQGPAALLAACYFSMARLSSLAPPNRGSYDASRYPTVGDVTFTQNGLSLCIKWAKNRQLPGQHLTAPLLPLGTSPACPVRREGAAPSAPLFVGGGGGTGRHLYYGSRGPSLVGRPAYLFGPSSGSLHLSLLA